MVRSRYDNWLKTEMQKEQSKESDKLKEIFKTISVMGGAPLSQRGNGQSNDQMPPGTQFNYTGLGEDGVLQPDNPTKVVSTTDGPATLHEGELEIRFPDGNTQVIPADKVPQDLLRQMEFQGFKGGGQFKRYQAGGQFSTSSGGQGGTTPPNIPVHTGDKKTPPTIPVNTGGNTNTSGGTILPPTIPIANPPIKNQTITPNTQTGTPVDPIQIGTQTPIINPQILTPNQGTVKVIDPIQIGTQTPDIQQQQFTIPEQKGQQGQQDKKPPPVTPWNQYMNQLLQLSQGQGALQDQLQAQATEQFKGEEQAAKGAMSQELAQAGIGGREAMTEQAMQSRQIGQQEAQVQGDLLKQRGDQAFAAAQQLPGQQLAGEQFQQQVKQQDFQNQMNQAMIGLKAGDYKGVNDIFKQLGLPPVDFTKLQSIEDANLISKSINDIISGLGPNADPKLLAFLGGLKGQGYTKMWDALGIDVNGGSIGGMSLGDLLNSINTGTNTGTITGVGKTVQAWLDVSAGGEVFKGQLQVTDAGQKVLEGIKNGDASSLQEYGMLAGAAFAQDNGYKLNNAQKDLLKKYDLYDETQDISKVKWEDIEPAYNNINKAIKEGNLDKAKTIYDGLNADEKKAMGKTLDEMIRTETDYKDTIGKVTSGSFEEVIKNFPKNKDDPMYKDLAENYSVQGLGAKIEHTGAGNNQWYYENIGNKSKAGMKMQKGDLIVIDGTIYVFDRVDLKTKSGSDNNEYHFVDPLTGKAKTITAGKG